MMNLPLHSRAIKLIRKALFLGGLPLLVPTTCLADWVESHGQATIINGDKERARQQAVAEALRQALLFSGASIQSVQTLTNGLLSNDELQVRASGEVRSLDLVDEVWSDDRVNIRLRADIFARQKQCHSAHLVKNVVTTYFPIMHRQQAIDGQIFDLSKSVPQQLAWLLSEEKHAVQIGQIVPQLTYWDDQSPRVQTEALARQHGAQFVLAAKIVDVGIVHPPTKTFRLLPADPPQRQFGIDVSVIDAVNGATLINQRYQTQAAWEFDKYSSVDVNSQSFWQSAYGRASEKLLRQMVDDLASTLSCYPLSGRIIESTQEFMMISLGQAQGVKVGDEMSLYRTQNVTDAFGKDYMKYVLHPVEMEVVEAYTNMSKVVPVDKSLLINIQTNGFVAIR